MYTQIGQNIECPMKYTSIELSKMQKYLTVKQDWLGWQKDHECICVCGKTVYKKGVSLRHYPNSSCGCKRGKWQYLGENKSLRNSLYLAYKTNAVKRKVKFLLSREEVFTFFKLPCFYCGITNSNSIKTRRRKGRKELKDRLEIYQYNGIDRLDSNIGYELSNCVACCKKCNIAKSNYSLEEFKEWVKSVYIWMFNDQPKGVGSSDSKRETP